MGTSNAVKNFAEDTKVKKKARLSLPIVKVAKSGKLPKNVGNEPRIWLSSMVTKEIHNKNWWL